MKNLYGPGRKQQYVSEYEQFMNGYLSDHPEVERDKLLGWRIWWERHVDPKEVAEQAQAKPGKPPYHSYRYE